jgi:hypothetical protein
MPISIDEVTAEVAPPVETGPPEPPADERATSPSELRRVHEHFQRLEQRAMRVCAD